MALIWKKKYQQFEEAQSTLLVVVEKYKSKDDIIRDSMIQRFEYTVEAFWKMLKAYLSEEKGIEAVSPKSVIREGRNVGLFSEAETELALEMIGDRNRSSHAYAIKLAIEIAKKIPRYAKLMEKVSKKI